MPEARAAGRDRLVDGFGEARAQDQREAAQRLDAGISVNLARVHAPHHSLALGCSRPCAGWGR
ncbi:MAG: hypothetical protein M0005_00860 [Actinomycetota bacterium]|nr:hypothetical protein [Actinomycetota bacterium]